MTSVCRVVALAALILFADRFPCSAQGEFSPACSKPNYPSPPPAKPLGIDAQCGISGAGGEEAAQDAIKNNFCASGEPKVVTIPALQKLQADVESDPSINFGDAETPTRKKGPTTDRAPLKKLGEGELVTLQAYVLFARQEGAESVNCEQQVPDDGVFHDIHIELVDSPGNKDECSGVVAEMIPHHRPDAWTADNVEKVANAKLMVRVTGQLFFDSSHVPCQAGKAAGDNPARSSLWEIHPIYKFEVCSEYCTAAAAAWVPLDQWLLTAAKTRR